VLSRAAKNEIVAIHVLFYATLALVLLVFIQSRLCVIVASNFERIFYANKVNLVVDKIVILY